MVIDRVALSDVARSNPQLQTVDVFASRMAEDEVFEGVEGKCTIEATPTDTSDLQLALTATNDGHSGFCLRKSEVNKNDSKRARQLSFLFNISIQIAIVA